MADEPKSRTAAKKMRRRKPREEFVDYVVEIDGWDWGYSWSLNLERRPIDPYREFRHLQVRGTLLQPTWMMLLYRSHPGESFDGLRPAIEDFSFLAGREEHLAPIEIDEIGAMNALQGLLIDWSGPEGVKDVLLLFFS
ncbi:hypothetical protein IVB02_18810 [Bradyrhizobium sp. 166]|uniref:hypothetical protein n=1 Tax=Bradyrhizobium sp. 166 TaxID=2782638 RepID=UPI001FFA73F7|nr:hypothetical protein [Bradyrhizobium sp. 166]MCK1603436.1 hypothetical protein [Bradyrhizobium sp. 166]